MENIIWDISKLEVTTKTEQYKDLTIETREYKLHSRKNPTRNYCVCRAGECIERFATKKEAKAFIDYLHSDVFWYL